MQSRFRPVHSYYGHLSRFFLTICAGLIVGSLVTSWYYDVTGLHHEVMSLLGHERAVARYCFNADDEFSAKGRN